MILLVFDMESSEQQVYALCTEAVKRYALERVHSGFSRPLLLSRPGICLK